jgi:hypothetical protein
MGSVGSSNTSTFTVPQGQRDWEDKYRNSDVEHGAYFDKDGNVLVEATGNADEINFDPSEVNHNVEQRVWNDEEVNFTHNHPENTIFSPADVEAFEAMENHSERAVLPNGTSYTLIREQARTSNTWVYNETTKEFELTFEPKHIAGDYRKEYSKVWDPGWAHVKATTKAGTPERKQAEAELDKRVASHMENWLNKNAKSYGYRFEKS